MTPETSQQSHQRALPTFLNVKYSISRTSRLVLKGTRTSFRPLPFDIAARITGRDAHAPANWLNASPLTLIHLSALGADLASRGRTSRAPLASCAARARDRATPAGAAS